jgi:hypothetical protein
VFVCIDEGKSQKATKKQPLPRNYDEANKDDSGNFITYFVLFCIVAIGGYVLYHKRQRVSYQLAVFDRLYLCCISLFACSVCVVYIACLPCFVCVLVFVVRLFCVCKLYVMFACTSVCSCVAGLFVLCVVVLCVFL